MSCLFCKIISKEIPAKVCFEDEDFIAFSDIYPKAKVHILLVPKKHIASLGELEDIDQELMGKMMIKARDIAKEAGIIDGFRFVTNSGENAGQTVKHIHAHILGGEALSNIA